MNFTYNSSNIAAEHALDAAILQAETSAVQPVAPTTPPNTVWNPQTKQWVDAATLPAAPPPPEPVKRTKVDIVGFAPHWWKARFTESDREIWSLNEAYDLRMPTDGSSPWEAPRKEGRLRWFEIHIREGEYDGNPFLHSRNQSNEHAAKMAALGVTVYMQKHWDDIPQSIPYPLEAITQKYSRYFTNSISWMIALAIEEGFTEIGLFGVDMATTTEYGYERPSCEYILGWVRALGIRLVMPDECDLLKSAFLYGFEADKAGFLRAKLDNRKQELRGKRHAIENEMERLKLLQHQLIGAEEDLNYVKEVSLGGNSLRRLPQAEG